MVLTIWYFRGNETKINTELKLEIWNVVENQNHNFNTDLIFWDKYFYMIYQHSKTHFFDNNSKLVIIRSKDCRKWENMSEIKYENQEFRDPKLVIINNKLFLYALKNVNYDPEPYQTFYSTSKDGYKWSSFKVVEPKGYLFWKPKTLDGRTWYNTAYWHEHGKSILLKSTDGIKWEFISEIYEGETNDETALEFLQDGKMIITARLEAKPGWHSGSKNASTLISQSDFPYTYWNSKRSYLARFDGPALLNINNNLIGAGRFDPDGRDHWYGIASIFSRKRTALYLIRNQRLFLITELPSCGDTSYPGMVVKDGYLYISYYTNETEKDYPWIMGMFSSTYIKIAKIDLISLESYLKKF
jgi:hypothetical protein